MAPLLIRHPSCTFAPRCLRIAAEKGNSLVEPRIPIKTGNGSEMTRVAYGLGKKLIKDTYLLLSAVFRIIESTGNPASVKMGTRQPPRT